MVTRQRGDTTVRSQVVYGFEQAAAADPVAPSLAAQLSPAWRRQPSKHVRVGSGGG
jgi:hypothetical protein